MGLGTKWNHSNLNPYTWIKKRDEKARKQVEAGEDVGTHIDFITWNTLTRPSASIVGGITFTLLLITLDSILGADLIDFWFGLALIALFSFYIWKSEEEKEVVPEGRMAMVNWFGIPLRIYRHTGEYSWTAKRLGFGRVKVFKEPMTDEAGFFYTKPVQVKIWNVFEEVAAKRSNLLEAITKTGSDISANLLLVLRMRDPMPWIRIVDPMMDIGERARMSFRTAVSFFTGKDLVSVKNLLTEMLTGHRVLACFLKSQVGNLPRHSLVRNHGGDPMFAKVLPTDDIDTLKQDFLERLEQEADPEILKNANTKDDKPYVEEREIAESLSEVLHACGVTLERASVGTINLPPSVVEASRQADAQPYQQVVQEASARASIVARRIMTETTAQERNDPNFADAQALAAAMDPDSTVQYVHIGGGSKGGGDSAIERAAAVLAAAMNNKKGKP